MSNTELMDQETIEVNGRNAPVAEIIAFGCEGLPQHRRAIAMMYRIRRKVGDGILNAVAYTLLKRIEVMKADDTQPTHADLLESILNSDMAQREEDEGNVSEILNKVRAALGKPIKEAVSG